ncbi:MAG: hypothetical protein HQL12_06960 [Candidatus Omnitrophica bacterium]|nr:hypothetical protein [Candidatus Omnitrophota bacterium]
MIKLFFLLIVIFMGAYSLKAQEVSTGDQQFVKDLDSVKSPFETGLPKPIAEPIKPPPAPKPPEIKPAPKPKPKPIIPPAPIVFPDLKLQGVIVGGGIQEAIINDTAVSLHDKIQGAELYLVTKKEVDLVFKGKKIVLKVE